MPIVNMKDMLKKAAAEGYAVGAFNILNELTARAVVARCEELRAPVILQTSVGTVKQIGVKNIIGFSRSVAQLASVPVALHLDHCKDLQLAKDCIDSGWSSVMIDASHCSLEENISLTRQIVSYAKGSDVSVEGELGAIAGVEDELSVDEGRLASVEDSIRYCAQTGVDAFAPAIGTAHGMYKGEPKLDFDRFSAIRNAVPTPLVIHGGTGLASEVFIRLVKLGASKINISTALKQAYMDAVQAFFRENPGDTNPLHLDAYAQKCVAQMAEEHIVLFNSKGRC